MSVVVAGWASLILMAVALPASGASFVIVGEWISCRVAASGYAATCEFSITPGEVGQLRFEPPGTFATQSSGLEFEGFPNPTDFPVGEETDPVVVGTIRFHNFDMDAQPPSEATLQITVESEEASGSVRIDFPMSQSSNIDLLPQATPDEIEMAKQFCFARAVPEIQTATLCDDLLSVDQSRPLSSAGGEFTVEISGFDPTSPAVLSPSLALIPEGRTTSIPLMGRIVAVPEPSETAILVAACAGLALSAWRGASKRTCRATPRAHGGRATLGFRPPLAPSAQAASRQRGHAERVARELA
jgi:hypothetical protein